MVIKGLLVGELRVTSLSFLLLLLLGFLFFKDHMESEAWDLDLVIFLDGLGLLASFLLLETLVDELSCRDPLDAGSVIVSTFGAR